jgi:PIN domain nuclease of toxin-antitoxin system
VKLLLDTHVVLALLRRELAGKYPVLESVLLPQNEIFASAASLWEIGIKTRLGKLDPGMPLPIIGAFLQKTGIPVLSIDRHHVVASVDPPPPHRDPFDYILLAQCGVEDMRLVTFDRALADHPLAWRS